MFGWLKCTQQRTLYDAAVDNSGATHGVSEGETQPIFRLCLKPRNLSHTRNPFLANYLHGHAFLRCLACLHGSAHLSDCAAKQTASPILRSPPSLFAMRFSRPGWEAGTKGGGSYETCLPNRECLRREESCALVFSTHAVAHPRGRCAVLHRMQHTPPGTRGVRPPIED